METEIVTMLDLNKPAIVEVQISEDGTKIWVNVDGLCRLRAYDCGHIEVEDNRKNADGQPA